MSFSGMPANKRRRNDGDGESLLGTTIVVVMQAEVIRVCARNGGWEFDEGQDIGIILEYSSPRKY